MNEFMKLILFLTLVTVILIAYIKQLNQLFGGYDDCAICTPLHFNGYLSNWTLSHYIVFVIVGYLAPTYFKFIVFLGILWEVVELYFEYISKTNPTHLVVKLLHLDCKTQLTPNQFWNHYFGIRKFHHSKTLFWCSGGLVGSILDIMADIAGVYTGIFIARKF